MLGRALAYALHSVYKVIALRGNLDYLWPSIDIIRSLTSSCLAQHLFTLHFIHSCCNRRRSLVAVATAVAVIRLALESTKQLVMQRQW